MTERFARRSSLAVMPRHAPRQVVTPEQHLEVRFTGPLDELGVTQPFGYYIFVRRNALHWKALLIRFARPKDAELARAALLKRGLYTQARMQQAGAAEVYRVVMEALQW